MPQIPVRPSTPLATHATPPLGAILKTVRTAYECDDQLLAEVSAKQRQRLTQIRALIARQEQLDSVENLQIELQKAKRRRQRRGFLLGAILFLGGFFIGSSRACPRGVVNPPTNEWRSYY